jgi:hypothetical protein
MGCVQAASLFNMVLSLILFQLQNVAQFIVKEYFNLNYFPSWALRLTNVWYPWRLMYNISQWRGNNAIVLNSIIKVNFDSFIKSVNYSSW